MAKAKEYNLNYDGTTTASDFQKLRNSIKRSLGTVQDNIHKAAILCLREWFVGKNTDWIKWLLLDLSPFQGTVRVQTLVAWFEQFGGLSITIDVIKETISVKKDKKWNGERDATLFNEAKDKPFYKFAPPEKPIKMPEVSYTSLAAMLARREVLGDEIDYNKVVEEVKKAVAAARSSNGMKKWVEKAEQALANGEITLINPEKAKIHTEKAAQEAA